MRKIHLLLTTAWLAMAGHVYADELRVNDFTINPGETKTISVELNNPDQAYIAFEFFMILPEGISITEDEDGYLDAMLNSARISRHTLEVELSKDGSFHFLCYSNSNNVFKGTEGEILSMTITADESVGGGVQQGVLINQKLSDPNENKVMFDDFSFLITVNSATPSGVTITIPAEGVTTYCPAFDLDFSGMTAFKAYTASRYNSVKNTVVMQPAKDSPAGIGLYLVGKPGTYTVPIKAVENSYADLLIGTMVPLAIPVTEGAYTNLTFSINGTFTAATAGESIAANTAWLQVPTALYGGQPVTVDIVKEAVDGDLNKDGIVSVADVTILVDRIIGNN